MAREQNLLGIALLAGLVGAGLALLFAPKAGRELRQDLDAAWSRARARLRPEEIERSLTRIVHDTLDRAEDFLKTGNTMVETKIQALLSAIEAGKRAFEEEKARLERAGVMEESGSPRIAGLERAR